jgi:glutathionyl-hydroquinone reductase
LLLFGSSQKVSAESLGNYKNIEQKLSSGQLALAQSLIAAFSPTTNIENNYKTFYTLQRAYLQNQDLTMLQNIQLLLLAYQCPFTDGAIVYNARALYGLANMVSIDYNDTYCAQLGFSFKTNNSDSIGNTVISDQLYTELIRNEKVSKETFKNKTNYFLFPNPAKDELFVNSANTENELIQLEILDANAKTIAKQVVSINNYLGKLNLNLINGIYTVKITTKQGTYEYKKLIISN